MIKMIKKSKKPEPTHKLNIYIRGGSKSKDILCLEAHIDINSMDLESITYIPVEHLGIDDLSVSLVEDIIQGKIKNTYIHREDKENKIVVEINEGSCEANIAKYIELQDTYFPAKAELVKIEK